MKKLKHNNVGVAAYGDPLPKRNTQKGITLIALIITIIILLILAVVSIRLVINNGIIGKAETAVDQYAKAESEEKRKLLEQEVEMEKYSNVKVELTEEEATSEGWVWDENGYIVDYTGTSTELYIPEKIGNIVIKNVRSDTVLPSADKSKITKVVLSGKIEELGIMFCYKGFSNLDTVILKEGIEGSIAGYAFGGCDNLRFIVIPSTITEISDYGLACSGITNIVIPKTITTVGRGIFGWCKNPVTIHCEAESKPEGWSDNWLDYAPEGTTVDWGYKG